MRPDSESRRARSAGWVVQRTVVATISLAPAETQVEQLGPDDLVLQRRLRTPRNVAVDSAHAVTDNDWELGRVGKRARR